MGEREHGDGEGVHEVLWEMGGNRERPLHPCVHGSKKFSKKLYRLAIRCDNISVAAKAASGCGSAW